MMFAGQNKKVNRRVSAGPRLRPTGATLARFGVGALALAALAIAVALIAGMLDQNITQVSVTGRFQRG
jgi:hypothetical protein